MYKNNITTQSLSQRSSVDYYNSSSFDSQQAYLQNELPFQEPIMVTYDIIVANAIRLTLKRINSFPETQQSYRHS